MNEGQLKGRARLLIDQKILECSPVKIEIPKSGHVIWDEVEFQGVADLWKSFLLLPMEYEIIGTFFSPIYYSWVVVIESASIPENQLNAMLPIAIPDYRIVNENKVVIESVRIMA